MKILFLHFPLHPAWGGAEEHTLLLAQGFQKAGHTVRLTSSNPFLVERFKKEKFQTLALWVGWEPTSINALPLLPLTAIIASISFLILFLKQFAIDTVFCLSLTDKLLATPLALLFGKKVIWIEHTRIGRWLFQNPLRFWYLFLSKKVTIVAPSYFSRNQLLQLGVEAGNTTVIYHGIKSEALALPSSFPSLDGRGWGRVEDHSHPHLASPLKGEEPNAKAPSSLKNQNSTFTLGYLGRLTTEKGVGVIINALTKLPSDINLIIAGRGPMEAALKKLASDLGFADGTTSVTSPTPPRRGIPALPAGRLSDIGEEKHHRVKFLGSIKNKEVFFQDIDALVIPSIQAESFGLIALEAMSAGRLVIASRIGALPEIIQNQKTGLLFEPGNVTELADLIRFVYNDPSETKKIAQEARKRCLELFSCERMVREYLEML